MNLTAIQHRLQAPGTVAGVQAAAAAEACGFCGADRALVLAVHADRLLPQAEVAVEHPDSDALRLRALARPPVLEPGSAEAELVRRREGIGGVRGTRRSVLDGLGLRAPLVVPVAPEERAIALLVLDGDADPERAHLFAHLLAVALERTVLRARLTELAAELKHLTASANALAQEALRAPVSVSADYGYGTVFPLVDSPGHDQLRDLLTDRECEIARLLARGMTNPAIAKELHLSPDTVKAHVARILRKLGASNRTEAAARVLALAA